MQCNAQLLLPKMMGTFLTLFGPGGGGTLFPLPCYVFAYISANTRTSSLKKLDFS